MQLAWSLTHSSVSNVASRRQCVTISDSAINKSTVWCNSNTDTPDRIQQLGSVPFFSHPRSEAWPHHGSTFSIYPCPLSFWLTLPWRVLSMSSRPCMVFLACVHLALLLALCLSPGNSLVSSWCDHSMLASLLCTPALLRTTHLFSLLSTKPAESFSVLRNWPQSHRIPALSGNALAVVTCWQSWVMSGGEQARQVSVCIRTTHYVH